MYADGWKKCSTLNLHFNFYSIFIWALEQYVNYINRTTWTILVHMKLQFSQLA